MEIAKTQKKIADIFWGGVSHVHTPEREGVRESVYQRSGKKSEWVRMKRVFNCQVEYASWTELLIANIFPLHAIVTFLSHSFACNYTSLLLCC